MSETQRHISDERLVAYLDGALGDAARAEIDAALEQDPALAERLAGLDVPMAGLRAVMTPEVLSAPQMPEGLLAQVPAPFAAPPLAEGPADPAPLPRIRSRAWVPSLMAACFAAGIALTYVFTPAPPAPAKPGWIDAVASYQKLYVTETLQDTRQQPTEAAQVLARAARDFGVPLNAALSLEGLAFRRAQMLGWNGGPLLQVAYLADDGTPMALCLTRVSAADRGPKTAISQDLAGVSWVQDGVGYVLLGGDDTARVEALAGQVRARL